jgi:hypothetical protein
MTAPSFPITTITPASIQQNLTSDGLDTLGLTTLALSTRWAARTLARHSRIRVLAGLLDARRRFVDDRHHPHGAGGRWQQIPQPIR